MVERSTIEELASSVGIEPEFTDNWGQIHVTPFETKARILAGMGLLAHERGRSTAPAPCAEEDASLRLAQPSIVAQLNHPPKHLVFQVPAPGPQAEMNTLAATLTVTDEAGKSLWFSYARKDLDYLGTKKTDRGWVMSLGMP
ncbi:MAG: hypothetical protein JRI36_12630, partial [Deltaproteobacteria bacterium]|nr:hypothetical protein [Deltaproteobacteria bacterium]